jgi:hypothetical protein
MAMIGERRDQLDLVVGERSRVGAHEREDPEHTALPEQGYTQRGAPAAPPPRFEHFVFRIRQDIRDVNGPALRRGPSHDGPAPRKKLGPLAPGGQPVLEI